MRQTIKSLIILSIILFVPYQSVAVALENYDGLMQEALALRNEARFEEAEKLYSRIIAENPNDVDALVGRGFCYLQNEDFYMRAESDFQKVIGKTPCYIDAYYGLALIYKRDGRWQEARAVLEKALDNCSGDQKALSDLADISWRIGHNQLARVIDKKPPAERTKQQKGFLNELYFDYIHDWVKTRSDWNQVGITYVRHLFPDLSAGFSFAKYRRNDTDDYQIGLSFGYRYNMNLTIETQSYFATNRNILANQKHYTMLYYNLPSFTVIGAGLRLDEYENGWAEVGRFDIKQYVGSFYGEYVLLTGQDNFHRSVTTHIAKIGYENDEKLYCHVSYSRGDETLDLNGGSSFSAQLVESVIFNLKYFVNKKWGIILTGGPEYRDNKLYRTTGATSVFMRF